jgi:pimeloyl-ACP methyl ester carboxylesterase
VLVGEEDITTPPEASERMAERIPDARLIRLPRVGHMCNLEAPRQVNAILDAFWSTVQD